MSLVERQILGCRERFENERRWYMQEAPRIAGTTAQRAEVIY
jgi:hypothetical protein